jgi:hypothetical protein
VFFKANGEPIRNLQYPYTRWRQSLTRLRDVRYRKPYCARHTSVSWDLMTGRSALWVARQHGHSIATMLRFYAAWTEGALEADIAAIRTAMAKRTTPAGNLASRTPPQDVALHGETLRDRIGVGGQQGGDAKRIASGYASGHGRPEAKCSKD